MAIAKINEWMLPFLANGDTDNLSDEEINACVRFQEDFGTRFSVFEIDGEWVYDCAGICDITGEYSKCVWLYTEREDLDELNREFGVGCDEDEEI